MIILKSLLLIVLVISSISLIGLILLQRSKSEGLVLPLEQARVNRSSGRGQGMCFPKQPLCWEWSSWLVRFF